jgi:hypothetical protein
MGPTMYTGLSIPLLSPCVKGAGHKTTATCAWAGASDYASQSDWAVPQGAGHKNSFRYTYYKSTVYHAYSKSQKGTPLINYYYYLLFFLHSFRARIGSHIHVCPDPSLFVHA